MTKSLIDLQSNDSQGTAAAEKSFHGGEPIHMPTTLQDYQTTASLKHASGATREPKVHSGCKIPAVHTSLHA